MTAETPRCGDCRFYEARDIDPVAAERARGLTALANHFLHQHPADADGEPAPWPEPLSPALAGLIAGTRETIEPGELTSAEARDMIAWAGMTHDHGVARYDRSHEDHAAAVREFQGLHERAASEGPLSAAATTTRPIAAPAAGSSQTRIDELRAHAAYRDGRHPDHRAVVSELGDLLARVPNGTASATAPPLSAHPSSKERIAELNQALRDNKRMGSTERRQLLAELESELRAGDGAPGIPAPGAQKAPPATNAGGADRIVELRSHPGFRDGRHPQHKSVVAELGELLGAAGPAASG
ncbi:MAG: hypothetical protein ACREFK_10015 [Stellaceae bacterium]